MQFRVSSDSRCLHLSTHIFSRGIVCLEGVALRQDMAPGRVEHSTLYTQLITVHSSQLSAKTRYMAFPDILNARTASATFGKL